MVEAGKEYLFIDGDHDISADSVLSGPHTHVGAELRAAREARGFDLAAVAQDLRIREQYLRALESGAYDELPGLPYATGFVQSYAKYLRLDPNDMVDRFKAEVDAAPTQPRLAFPQPVRYGRFPGAIIVAGGLLVAGLLYGGWHFYGPQQSDGPSTNVTAGKGSGTGGTAKSGGGSAAGSAGKPHVAAQAAGKSAADAAGATGKQAGTAAKTTGANNVVGGDSSKKSAGADASKRTVSADAPTNPDAGRADRTASDSRATGSGTRDEDVARDPTVGQSGTTSGAPKNATDAAKKSAPAQVAAVPKDRTIVLRATANAWVQIKDRENRVVFVKVLRTGDSYTVPDQAGLIMNVGNAGGLRVTVGGEAIKPLGPINMPVFNVSLDPKALLKHHN